MGNPDRTHKMLLEYEDEFAEIFSVFALSNKQKLDQTLLREAATEYEHIAHDKPEELRRDVVKLYGDTALGLIVCGLENQMTVDISMPVRMMGYDWTRYRYQLEHAKPLNQDTRISPIFSHVLNFSYKQKWRWPHSLRDLVNLPPALAEFFQDYKIGVTNLAWLTPEERAKLTGDFRAFVEALCELRETGRITGIKQPIKHIEAMLALLAATTNSQSFELIDKTDFEGGKTTMCEIIDKWENQLRSEGYKNGEIVGFANGEAVGYANGEAVGYANGEKQTSVRVCRDFGKTQSETADYLVQKMHLTREQANEAVKAYWAL
jgi:hypothetical protein